MLEGEVRGRLRNTGGRKEGKPCLESGLLLREMVRKRYPVAKVERVKASDRSHKVQQRITAFVHGPVFSDTFRFGHHASTSDEFMSSAIVPLGIGTMITSN